MHPELPYIAFLAAILVLIPLPWHWRAGNIATLSMIAWLFVVNVIYGVDAIIWHRSLAAVVPVWCDITTKILIGANIALPAACMCVCIHLEQVASVRRIMTMAWEKRRRQIIEAVLCFLVPMIWMALHYIVQGHRFDIIELYGCRPSTYVSIPAIFLIWVPSLLMSIVSLVFAGLALRHFMRRRFTFAKHLENSNTGLTTSRYLRLMALALVQMVISAASVSATLAFSVIWDMRPWTNWADVHWNFSRIDFYPVAFMPKFISQFYYLCWWIAPISAFVFFLFFAIGQEAVNGYHAGVAWFRIHLLRRQPPTASVGRFAPLSYSSNTVGVTAKATVDSLSTVDSPLDGPLSPTNSDIVIEKGDDYKKTDDRMLLGHPLPAYGAQAGNRTALSSADVLPSYYTSRSIRFSLQRPASVQLLDMHPSGY